MTFLFVESPLNLINAIEAIDHFNISEYKIIIRLNASERNNQQIKNLINILKIDEVNIFFMKINNKFDYLKAFIFYFYFLFQKKDKILLGNFDSKFLKPIVHISSSSNIILFDDGTKTLDIQERFKSSSNFYNMFTMYKLDEINKQKLYKNNFKIIKNIVTSNLKIDKNSILFLGSKLNEEGDISKQYYLELISKISFLYKDKTIYYIPHRDEDKDKVQEIEVIDNISIKYLDYPIELYGLYEDTIPYKVVSFFSTALITMQNFYNIEAIGYKFNYSSSPRESYIDNIYNYYQKEIKILDLN